MSFLTINGITVSTAVNPTKARDTIGAGITRAQSGAARSNFNAKKWHFKGKTIPLVQTEALFLRALLDGLGDRWTFDADFYSDKGVINTANTGCTIITTLPTPQWGTGSMQIMNPTGTITWPVDSTGAGANKNWTACFWASVAGGGPVWHRFIYTIDSLGGVFIYKDGVAGALPSGLSIQALSSGTTLNIQNGVGVGALAIDDLLYVPAYCPASFVSGLDALMQRQAWAAPYPSLAIGALATADDMHPLALVMLGTPGDEQMSMGRLPGASFTDNLAELNFELIEV